MLNIEQHGYKKQGKNFVRPDGDRVEFDYRDNSYSHFAAGECMAEYTTEFETCMEAHLARYFRKA